MKVVFMGTPDFAVETLEAIVGAGHEVAAVVTQPDKPMCVTPWINSFTASKGKKSGIC